MLCVHFESRQAQGEHSRSNPSPSFSDPSPDSWPTMSGYRGQLSGRLPESKMRGMHPGPRNSELTAKVFESRRHFAVHRKVAFGTRTGRPIQRPTRIDLKHPGFGSLSKTFRPPTNYRRRLLKWPGWFLRRRRGMQKTSSRLSGVGGRLGMLRNQSPASVTAPSEAVVTCAAYLAKTPRR